MRTALFIMSISCVLWGCSSSNYSDNVREWLEQKPYYTSRFSTGEDVMPPGDAEWVEEGSTIEAIEMVLIEFLRRNDSSVELSQVAFALGFFISHENIPVLIEALSHDEFTVRLQAAVSLGRVKDERAISKLCHVAATDENVNVRANAVVALGKIGDIRVLPCLRAALRDHNSFVVEIARRRILELESD